MTWSGWTGRSGRIRLPRRSGLGRRCLLALIEGMEVREDDSAWLLVGEGPLATDDIRLAIDRQSPEAENATTGQERDAPRHAHHQTHADEAPYSTSQ